MAEYDFAPLIARLRRLADALATDAVAIQLALERLRGDSGNPDPLWQDPLERRAILEDAAAKAGISGADLLTLLYMTERK